MEEKEYSIYISYSEQANELTNKRQSINSIYIAINSALIGFIVSSFKDLGIALSCVGFVVSWLWLFMLISYRKLSISKFEVIAMMEKDMKFKPYDLEWQAAKNKKYIAITILEIVTSIIFILGYISLFIISIFTKGV